MEGLTTAVVEVNRLRTAGHVRCGRSRRVDNRKGRERNPEHLEHAARDLAERRAAAAEQLVEQPLRIERDAEEQLLPCGAVAGPDAALSIQWMRPAGRGFEWIASGTAGLAWFAGADHLIVPQDHFQPYLSIEVGAGW